MSYLHFCRDFLVMCKNDWIRKLRLVLKFMTSETGQQIIAMHVLPYISRSKGNQAVKFDQLTKYGMRNIILKNLAETEVGKLVPDLYCFLKTLYMT